MAVEAHNAERMEEKIHDKGTEKTTRDETTVKAGKAGLGWRIAVNVCRIPLALALIFSGFVKAIDPLGTQYKINDYLEALHLEQYVPSWATLTTSVLLSALEFCLGIFLLFAIRRRLVSRIIVAFMAIMTIITVWLWGWNPIKDCGCFGDAIHLTNGQTLLKNIALLAMAATIAWKPRSMARFVSKSNQWIVINYTALFILVSAGLSLWYLPFFDFRPFHIGADIRKGMEIPKGAKQPKFETTFILEKGGVRKEFTIDNYPDSTWTFIDSKTVEVEKGYEPPIQDFSITDQATGDDITDRILSNKGYTFVLVAPHLELADDTNFGDLDRIYEYAQDHHYAFIALTASGESAVAHWRDITGAEYPFYITDGTTLETVIRSNPGLLLIHNGVIINKWSHNGLPSQEELSAPLEKSKLGKLPENGVTKRLTFLLLWFVLPLLLLTFADRTWQWTQWIRRKKKEKATPTEPKVQP